MVSEKRPMQNRLCLCRPSECLRRLPQWFLARGEPSPQRLRTLRTFWSSWPTSGRRKTGNVRFVLAT